MTDNNPANIQIKSNTAPSFKTPTKEELKKHWLAFINWAKPQTPYKKKKVLFIIDLLLFLAFVQGLLLSIHLNHWGLWLNNLNINLFTFLYLPLLFTILFSRIIGFFSFSMAYIFFLIYLGVFQPLTNLHLIIPDLILLPFAYAITRHSRFWFLGILLPFVHIMLNIIYFYIFADHIIFIDHGIKIFLTQVTGELLALIILLPLSLWLGRLKYHSFNLAVNNNSQ